MSTQDGELKGRGERNNMPANNRQVGGNHYNQMKIQPWEADEAWSSQEEFRGYLRLTAIDYLARAPFKGQYETDIKKASHVLQKLIEVMEK